jgi:hypothetical protein
MIADDVRVGDSIWLKSADFVSLGVYLGQISAANSEQPSGASAVMIFALPLSAGLRRIHSGSEIALSLREPYLALERCKYRR